MEERLRVLLTASVFVQTVAERNPLELYRQGPPFGGTSTYTAADQEIDHTIRVANWLLGDDNA